MAAIQVIEEFFMDNLQGGVLFPGFNVPLIVSANGPRCAFVRMRVTCMLRCACLWHEWWRRSAWERGRSRRQSS